MSITLSPVATNKNFCDIDLSNYAKELQQIRTSRCLNLRRSIYIAQSKMLASNPGSCTKFVQTLKKTVDLSNAQQTQISLESIVEALQTASASSIKSVLDSLVQSIKTNPKLVASIMKNSEIQEFINSLLENEENPIADILTSLAVLVPYCGPSIDNFVDTGITMSLLFILSGDNQELAIPAIQVVKSISGTTGYARNSLLCSGVHTILVDLASQNRSTPIADAACDALNSIFGNPEPIDSEIIQEVVPLIISAIQGQSADATNSILSTLINISAKLSSVVYIFYEQGLYEIIVEMIREPAYTAQALRLCGNMAVSQPQQVKVLLQHGIIDTLMDLLNQQNYTADVFWVLSNIFETESEELSSLIGEDFIQATLDITENATFDAKRESAYFLSTVVIYSGTAHTESFFSEPIFSILTEVIGSGIHSLVCRCIDAFVFLLFYAVNSKRTDEYLEYATANNLEDSLRDLEESGSSCERVNYLLSVLNSFKE